MLSCKDFVQESAKIIDNEKLSLGQSLSMKFHLFFCHHCRNYLKQSQTVVSVAHGLNSEPATDQEVDTSITKMKDFSSEN